MEDEAVKINKKSKNQSNIDEKLKHIGFKKTNVSPECGP